MQSINRKGLSDKIGITDVTIKSGENKDLLNPLQDPNPEQMKLLQDVIDTMYARFRNIVAERRNIEYSQLEELADGRIFSADTAMKENLIDGIGYWDDVVAKATELVGDDVRIVRYANEPTFWDMFGRVQQPAPLSRLMSRLQGPQFMYLWRP
jgi:protease-4